MSSLIASLNVAELTHGDSIVFEAIDPVTGGPVAGVVVSRVAITNDAPDTPAAELPPNPVPVLATVPNAKLDSGLPG